MGEQFPSFAPKQEQPDLDKNRLNELVRTMSAPVEGRAARFEDVQLTEADRAEIRRVADMVTEHVMAGVQGSSEWTEFQKLAADFDRRGLSLSASFPPSWLEKGSPDAGVHEESKPGERAKIVVPERIFNAYYWAAKADQLRNSLDGSGSQSATGLGRELKEAAYFLKQTGKI